MSRAFFIIDVQNDFTDGALGVHGGATVAESITAYLEAHPDRYDHVIASRDWHDADSDNGGHFADVPDYVVTWPRHCVAGTVGAEYHAAIDQSLIEVHVLKGQGRPAYSIFEGEAHDHAPFVDELDRLGVTEIDIAGIATDYCVLASAMDARETGRTVRVITDLVVGVAPESSSAALAEMQAAGIELITAKEPA